jgi:hypothetical protein
MSQCNIPFLHWLDEQRFITKPLVARAVALVHQLEARAEGVENEILCHWYEGLEVPPHLLVQSRSLRAEIVDVLNQCGDLLMSNYTKLWELQCTLEPS